MTRSTRYSELSDKQRRALLRRAVLRPIVTAVALTALFFVVPMTNVEDLGSVTFLVLVLVGVSVVCVWQISRVVKADHPVLQAIEALAAVVPIYLIGFATVYFLTAGLSDQNFSEPLSRMGSLYFTLSVFTTVGFGDITASTDFARAVVSIQMVGNLVIIALGGRLLVAAVRRGQARNARR